MVGSSGTVESKNKNRGWEVGREFGESVLLLMLMMIIIMLMLVTTMMMTIMMLMMTMIMMMMTTSMIGELSTRKRSFIRGNKLI